MNIRYAIVKNEMPASSTEAKYLGKIIPNGVRNRSQMTALALKSEHFAEATFAAVVDAAVDLTQELCAEGRDVDWGPVRFLAKMHGSLPYEDAAFADGTASLTLDADATNVTRTVLDTLVPVKVGAAEIASLVKVSNVMDVATERFGTVVGSTEFAVLGNGITFDQEGEYVKALDKKTLEAKGTATVLRVSKGQRAYAKFAPRLAPGDYTFEIATRGLLGETTPRVFRKPVTAYVDPAATELTGVRYATREYTEGTPQTVLGQNLPATWGAAVSAKAVFKTESMSAPTTVTLSSADVTDVSASGFTFDMGKLNKQQGELFPGETFPVAISLVSGSETYGPVTFTAQVP